MRRGTSGEEGQGAQDGDNVARLLGDSVLRVVGREGLENTTVQVVVEDAEISPAVFELHFENLREAFRVAYERKACEVCEEMLRAGREAAGWAEGLRRALRVLLLLVAEQPHTARALIIEGGRPGSPTTATQNLILKRLARALESARRQPESRHSAPPLTGDLMVGAITNTLQGLLVKGESIRAPELLGDYTYLVMLAFFDEETAYRELDSAQEED
jgi:AcrR family transcriptional regulator